MEGRKLTLKWWSPVATTEIAEPISDRNFEVTILIDTHAKFWWPEAARAAPEIARPETMAKGKHRIWHG